MQNYNSGVAKQKTTEILTPPPRSGHFSVYAQKLSAQAFVWLCFSVVWGNVANYAGARDSCNSNCGVQIAFAVIGWFCVSFILVLNCFAEKESHWRDGCFSHALEAQFTALLVLLWIPIVATASTVGDELGTPIVATWFSWLGFLGSFYATFKAYHSFKEEDLPSERSDGFDEEDYVYG